MAFDRHVVGWVGENRSGAVLLHQHPVRALFKCIAAIDPMWPELPKIPGVAYRRPRLRLGYLVIGISLRSSILDQQIDLADLEACHLEAEIKVHRRELTQLLTEKLVVPGSDLGEPVIG